MHESPILAEVDRIPVGISACLLGEKVRYNGGHKRSSYCLEVLADCFDFKPFCPELAVGLGVPREAIRLVGDPAAPRALGTQHPDLDVTDALAEKGRDLASRMPDLCGYILIKGSPSCGMERVKIYHENGIPNAAGRGIFAAALMAANPLLPVEEEGRLHDPVLRENFITRVFALNRWKTEVEADPGYHALLQYHSRSKYLLMAHSYEGYRQLGRYLAEAHSLPLQEAMDTYIAGFMAHMAQRASRKSHVNVLMHILGYLKKSIDSDCKQELLDVIERYRRAEVHLVVPLTLIKHYLKRYGSDYIQQQSYLDPHPYQLGLRNFI
ncbi:YbgA family protein [Marinobacterium aestuariivivens]|uniref:YbgA family protein n=1 Tax=Marinobacterium aestuariivivens TaxID=1698799 RepID=A0ABW1ZUY9_9GAMM